MPDRGHGRALGNMPAMQGGPAHRRVVLAGIRAPKQAECNRGVGWAKGCGAHRSNGLLL